MKEMDNLQVYKKNNVIFHHTESTKTKHIQIIRFLFRLLYLSIIISLYFYNILTPSWNPLDYLNLFLFISLYINFQYQYVQDSNVLKIVMFIAIVFYVAIQVQQIQAQADKAKIIFYLYQGLYLLAFLAQTIFRQCCRPQQYQNNFITSFLIYTFPSLFFKKFTLNSRILQQKQQQNDDEEQINIEQNQTQENLQSFQKNFYISIQNQTICTDQKINFSQQYQQQLQQQQQQQQQENNKDFLAIDMYPQIKNQLFLPNQHQQQINKIQNQNSKNNFQILQTTIHKKSSKNQQLILYQAPSQKLIYQLYLLKQSKTHMKFRKEIIHELISMNYY